MQGWIDLDLEMKCSREKKSLRFALELWSGFEVGF